MHCCFPHSLILSVISSVREICLSNRCLKYFDRVFVSVSSIKLMWWQADSKKRFAPNVLEPRFSSSLSHLKISFSVITLARALLKNISPCPGPLNPDLLSFWTDIPWRDSVCGQEEVLMSRSTVEDEICPSSWIHNSWTSWTVEEESLRYLLHSCNSRTTGMSWNSFEVFIFRLVCVYQKQRCWSMKMLKYALSWLWCQILSRMTQSFQATTLNLF